MRRKRWSAVGISARKGSHDYPLAGLARCARCGWPKRGAFASGKRYYRDPARDQGRECEQRLVPAEKAEEAIGAFMQRPTLPSDWQNRVLKAIQDRSGERMEIAGAEARIERQLDRLKRLFVLGDMREQDCLLERARLEAKAAALIPPAMPDLERAGELLSNSGTIWDAAQLRERKQIVRTLIEALFLDRGVKGPIVAFQPKVEFAPLQQSHRSHAHLRPGAVLPTIGLSDHEIPCQTPTLDLAPSLPECCLMSTGYWLPFHDFALLGAIQ